MGIFRDSTSENEERGPLTFDTITTSLEGVSIFAKAKLALFSLLRSLIVPLPGPGPLQPSDLPLSRRANGWGGPFPPFCHWTL